LCRPYLSDSDLKGRLPTAQRAALGLVRPQPHNWPTAIVNVALGNAQGKAQPKIMDFLFRSSGTASQTLHVHG
jgi:hypothetical protein